MTSTRYERSTLADTAILTVLCAGSVVIQLPFGFLGNWIAAFGAGVACTLFCSGTASKIACALIPIAIEIISFWLWPSLVPFPYNWFLLCGTSIAFLCGIRKGNILIKQ